MPDDSNTHQVSTEILNCFFIKLSLTTLLAIIGKQVLMGCECESLKIDLIDS